MVRFGKGKLKNQCIKFNQTVYWENCFAVILWAEQNAWMSQWVVVGRFGCKWCKQVGCSKTCLHRKVKCICNPRETSDILFPWSPRPTKHCHVLMYTQCIRFAPCPKIPNYLCSRAPIWFLTSLFKGFTLFNYSISIEYFSSSAFFLHFVLWTW